MRPSRRYLNGFRHRSGIAALRQSIRDIITHAMQEHGKEMSPKIFYRPYRRMLYSSWPLRIDPKTRYRPINRLFCPGNSAVLLPRTKHRSLRLSSRRPRSNGRVDWARLLKMRSLTSPATLCKLHKRGVIPIRKQMNEKICRFGDIRRYYFFAR